MNLLEYIIVIVSSMVAGTFINHLIIVKFSVRDIKNNVIVINKSNAKADDVREVIKAVQSEEEVLKMYEIIGKLSEEIATKSSITVGKEAPKDPKDGDVWFDTS